MNDKVVSFRLGKKRIKRAKKEKLAAENRHKFGQSKSTKSLAKARRDKAKSDLDGHKLDE